jgi:hypothetical protein
MRSSQRLKQVQPEFSFQSLDQFVSENRKARAEESRKMAEDEAIATGFSTAMRNLEATRVLTFDPAKDNVLDFVALFTNLTSSFSDEQKLQTLLTAVKGRALTWLLDRIKNGTGGVKDHVDALKLEFLEDQKTLLLQAVSVTQKPSQTPLEFFFLMQDIFRKCSPAFSEEQQLVFTVNGLDPIAKELLLPMKPSTIKELKESIQLILPILEARKKRESVVTAVSQTALESVQELKSERDKQKTEVFYNEMVDRLDQLELRSQNGRGQRTFTRGANNSSFTRGAFNPARGKRCYRCNRFNHFARDCVSQQLPRDRRSDGRSTRFQQANRAGSRNSTSRSPTRAHRNNL